MEILTSLFIFTQCSGSALLKYKTLHHTRHTPMDTDLTFILCLSEVQISIRYKTTYTLLVQMIPHILLTVVQIVEIMSYGYRHCLIALCVFLQRFNAYP